MPNGKSGKSNGNPRKTKSQKDRRHHQPAEQEKRTRPEKEVKPTEESLAEEETKLEANSSANDSTITDRNLSFVDTNVLEDDPRSIDYLREGGNVLALSLQSIIELDGLKNNPVKGYAAREALRKIIKLNFDRDKSLIVIKDHSFGKLNLIDHEKADHIILADFNTLIKNYSQGRYKAEYGDFNKLKFITNDGALGLLVDLIIKNPKVVIEEYKRGKVSLKVKPDILKKIKVSFSEVILDGEYFIFKRRSKKRKIEEIIENEGVICLTDINPFSKKQEGLYLERFAAIKKGNRFKIINPKISASGITPKSINGDGKNWHQVIALGQMLDPSIYCNILQGGAGTGKTLLALAAAKELNGKYESIWITKPMVPVENKDNMGYIKGGINSKMGVWFIPIRQNLKLLGEPSKPQDDNPLPRDKKIARKQRNKRRQGSEQIEDINIGDPGAEALGRHNIIYMPIQYFRGATLHNAIFIVDEAQNLTPFEAKVLAARAGENTKVIFTGDLEQIDLDNISDSSGLAHLEEKLRNEPMVSVINFRETVRSPFAALVEERL